MFWFIWWFTNSTVYSTTKLITDVGFSSQLKDLFTRSLFTYRPRICFTIKCDNSRQPWRREQSYHVADQTVNGDRDTEDSDSMLFGLSTTNVVYFKPSIWQKLFFSFVRFAKREFSFMLVSMWGLRAMITQNKPTQKVKENASIICW